MGCWLNIISNIFKFDMPKILYSFILNLLFIVLKLFESCKNPWQCLFLEKIEENKIKKKSERNKMKKKKCYV